MPRHAKSRKINLEKVRASLDAVAANTPTESEEELYEMPLEQIRKRATTGGWYR